MSFVKSLLFIVTIAFSLPLSSTQSKELSLAQVRSVENLHEAQKGFDQRWRRFEQSSLAVFPKWEPNVQENELQVRFDRLCKGRWQLYFGADVPYDTTAQVFIYVPEYEVEPIREGQMRRYRYPLAFRYNQARSSYEASLIHLDNLRFLIFSAPFEGNLPDFYQLLQEFQVSDLVRLTPIYNGKRESCYPYWEGHTNIHLSGAASLCLGDLEMRYFPVDLWKDHDRFDLPRLVALVKAVLRSDEKENEKLVAVHCRAGVGRTGTFLAACALIHEIDRQVAQGVDPSLVQVSVDKIAWKLVLQRPFAVSHFAQYQSLYQLVDYYTQLLGQEKS